MRSIQINGIDLPLTEPAGIKPTTHLRWPIVDYLRGNNQVVLELKASDAIDLSHFQNRRLIEIQPLCGVLLEISESAESAS